MNTLLITGCSTGIGYGAAVYFAQKGYKVFAGVRKESDVERLKKACAEVHPLILDVTKETDIQTAVELISSQVEGVFNLINNAGIAVAGPMEFVSLEDYRRQFEINFFGLVAMTKACLPLLRKTQGRVINVSSVAGRVASPFLGPYSASKFAVEAVSDALRREVAEHHVRVILVEPGPIQTPIWDKGLSSKDESLTTLPPHLEKVYGKAIDHFRKYVAQAAETALPIESVLKVFEQALESSSPQHRYMISKESLLINLVPLIPSRWVDRIMKLKINNS